MTGEPGERPETTDRLRRAVGGDGSAMEELFAEHRLRLRRMVDLRLDRRLVGRIDASDVVQETFLEAVQRLPDYVARPDMPFFLWLRFLTAQKVVDTHRHHLGVQARDAGREARPARPFPKADPESMTGIFLDTCTPPPAAAARNELRERLLATLNRMEPHDREILSLRHLEQLSNAEAARELGMDESAASKRYVRALTRMRAALGDLAAPRED